MELLLRRIMRAGGSYESRPPRDEMKCEDGVKIKPVE
jgi:hypothetical protein